MSSKPSSPSPVKLALSEIRRLRQRVDALERARTEPIAIVGMGVRFPGGATDAEQFHEQLCRGLDAIRTVPEGRWDVERYFSDDREAPGRMYTRHGGFLDDVAGFDPEFFGISPVEAATIDPQQRLLLEVTWETLEHAGISASSLRGSRTGVFLGIAAGDYGRMSLADVDAIDEYASLGTAFSVAGGRLSYVLGLHGPAVSVDTACSASLVALHLACQSLRLGECDGALAAGVNLILSPEITVNFCRAGMLAADGHCKTFDASADGYVRSEGCGVVMLKRLRDAQRDGDRIFALVRGSAVNQDGRSSGLTAPNGPAQEAVIRAALENAGLAPGQIGYVEAHGTGTSLGDPIELQALGEVFGQDRPSGRPLLVGSVKSNVGHLEAAAGMAGLVKTVQALRHGTIPPSRNFQVPNPHVRWDRLPLRVPTTLTTFEPIDGRRRAGLSSFGFSGTNVHVILEEPPARSDQRDAPPERPLHLLTLSAPRPDALRDLALRFAERLDGATEPFADLCFTANAGRTPFRHRLALRAADAASAAAALRAWREGMPSDVISGEVPSGPRPAIAFLYAATADGAAPIANALRRTAPVFARTLEECAEAAKPLLPLSLLEVLDPESPHSAKLGEHAYAQVAALAMQLALGDVWKSWGINPDVVVAHEVGEYAAAVQAGVFSMSDAVRLVLLRARADEGDAGALEESRALLATRTLHAPATPRFISSANAVVEGAMLARAEYWVDLPRRRGDLSTALRAARAEDARWLVELGVSPDTRTAAPAGGADEVLALAPVSGEAPWPRLLDDVARLFVAGADVDWPGVDRGFERAKVDLPRYPFQRRPFWLSTTASQGGSPAPVDAEAEWAGVCDATLERAELAPIDLNVGSYPAKWAALETLNRELGRNVLASLNAFDGTSSSDVDRVLERCRIASLYRPIVTRWLDALVAEGTLRREGASYVAARPVVVTDLSAEWAVAERLLADNPPLLAYLRNCASLLADVIAGRASALETLFPGGTFDLATSLYERSTVMRYVNGIAASALRAFVASRDPRSAIRVLEFGAGTGGTTSSLLPVLPPDRAQYDFTDVSEIFLEYAAERFRDRPFLRTRRFDLEQDVAPQGLVPGGYDVVVGANVLHAAKDLRASLARVQSLLAPGGMLMLVESTGHLAWHDFSTGLIEGWQHFTDELRRDTPLLPAHRWLDLLRASGFEGVLAAPDSGSAAEVLKQHVILARRAGASVPQAAVVAPQPVATSESPKVPVPSGPPAEISEFVARLRAAPPHEREEIAINAVRDQVVDVLHLDASRPPARDARLMDLGVDSLLAVRLRNVLQKRLGLPKKLPATLIFDYPTIARIGAFIVARHATPEAADPVAAMPVAVAAPERVADVAALSEAEAEALLLSRLEVEGLS